MGAKKAGTDRSSRATAALLTVFLYALFVALAWLAAQPTVVAPAASARTPEQLRDLLPVADLRLTKSEVTRLSEVSA